jgi:hypothetical protein
VCGAGGGRRDCPRDRQLAYISEQTAGPDQGRVSSFQLSNGTRKPLATGLTGPFHLTWSDATQASLLVAERDPANRITSINVAAASAQVIAGGVPVRPSSVAVIAPGQMLICSDQIVAEMSFLAFQPAGPALMGIGFIPFDKVVTTAGPLQGLADTTIDPTYFYQVKNTPFGGTLPLMINYMRALNVGAAYYRVFVQSTGLPNGLNTIWIEFVNAAGGIIAAFAADVYVAASANNGWGRQSQYDAQALIAFVLAP